MATMVYKKKSLQREIIDKRTMSILYRRTGNMSTCVSMQKQKTKSTPIRKSTEPKIQKERHITSNDDSYSR